MAQLSAGLLLYRWREDQLQVLLAHPGGPFFAHKDAGAWSIPKGAPEPGEALLDAAQRELVEETGITPRAPFLPLAPCRLKSGKLVHAWAFEGDADPACVHSNTFELEWPPRSGSKQRFPEVDRAAFFDVSTALQMINAGQRGFIEELARRLRADV